MRKRVPLAIDTDGVVFVDLPTYAMVGGSVLPIVPAIIDANGILGIASAALIAQHRPSVLVELPDGFPLLSNGQPDAAALHAMYREHSRFGSATWQPPAFLP